MSTVASANFGVMGKGNGTDDDAVPALPFDGSDYVSTAQVPDEEADVAERSNSDAILFAFLSTARRWCVLQLGSCTDISFQLTATDSSSHGDLLERERCQAHQFGCRPLRKSPSSMDHRYKQTRSAAQWSLEYSVCVQDQIPHNFPDGPIREFARSHKSTQC